MNDSPLLAASSRLDDAALIGETTWTWREVHAASIALAQQIHPEATVCNLCGSRIGFLIAWLAVLRRGCVQLLPPSGGHGDLVSILRTCARPVIVADEKAQLQPEWKEHASCIVQTPLHAMHEGPHAVLDWQPGWEAPLVRLYTSGSTGAPEAQQKTLGQLARGAQVLAARLAREQGDALPALQRIVSSVPPQHMFGLETSVMLSLVTGIPVQDGQPLLPADIRQAMLSGTGPAVWMATPVHLRALVQANESLQGCHLVIASTMPLAPLLAAQAEAATGATVLEIYGSTETGAIAMRRTSVDTLWRLLDHVRVEPVPDGTQVWGEHFGSPQRLLDEVELDASGGFRLAGRHGDIVKIAGRRASLAGLNLVLQEAPGLTDAVFYLPATGSPTERLVLIYGGDRVDRAVLLSWLRERIDPVFLPRSLIRLDRLPRTASSKLPRAALDEVFAAWKARGRTE